MSVNTLASGLFFWLICSFGSGIFLVVVTVIGLWLLRIFSAPKKAVLQLFVWAPLTYSEASEWRQSAAGHKPAVRYDEHSIKQFSADDTLTEPPEETTAEADARLHAVAPTPHVISQRGLGSEQIVPQIALFDRASGSEQIAQLILANGIQASHGIPPRVPEEKIEDPSMSAGRIGQHSSDIELGIPTDSAPCVPEATTAEPSEEIRDESLNSVLFDLLTPYGALQTDPAIVEPQLGLSPRSYGASNTASNTALCCPCCLDDMKNAKVIALLRCGHLFCEECLKTWAAKSISCPYCRASMLAS